MSWKVAVHDYPLLPPEMLYVASFQEACCCCSDYSSQIISYQTITADLL